MAEPGSPDMSWIQVVARNRWLRPEEICHAIRNHWLLSISEKPPSSPFSGSLYLYDRRKTRYFRKDGHKWERRKSGNAINEGHMKLKVGNDYVLHCYYSHGKDNRSFLRRCYSMCKELDLMHIVLVHYLDEKVEAMMHGSSNSTIPAEGDMDCTIVVREPLTDGERADVQSLVISPSACPLQDEVVPPFEGQSLLVGSPDISNVLDTFSLDWQEYFRRATLLPIISSLFFSAEMAHGWNGYGSHGTDSMSLDYNQRSSPAGEISSSLAQESEAPALLEEDRFPFAHLRLEFPQLGDFHSLIKACISARAQKRWTKISGVCKWFSVRKVVAFKSTSLPERSCVFASAQRRWTKISGVCKWFSVRKVVAFKRMRLPCTPAY